MIIRGTTPTVVFNVKTELDFAIYKMPFASRIDLEGIMFGEVSQRKTDTV